MATAAKKQFGSKVAKRVTAQQATDKLPKPAMAKTADKTSVPVKKPAVKRVTRATPASQTGLVNDPAGAAAKAVVTAQKIDIPADKPAPKSRAAKKQALFDKANAVPDPAAKVATPSTVKRVSRSNKRALVKLPADTEQKAAEVRATPAKKVAKPKVDAVKSDIAPAAKKAIKKAADALKAPVKPAEAAKKAPAKKAAAKRVKPTGELTQEQTQMRADLTFEATQLIAKAAAEGFVIEIGHNAAMNDGEVSTSEISVLTKQTAQHFAAEKAQPKVTEAINASPALIKSLTATDEAKKNLDLLNRFDALVKEIRAAGGKLNGDLQLSALIFNYREPVKEAKTASDRADAGIELKKRGRALADDAKKQGWELSIAHGLLGAHVVLTEIKK
jgi:DNA-binding protein HU-beta